MSDIFKNLSIHSSSSSLNSLFFSLCLVMYSRTYIIFFWQEFQSPRPSFVGWIGVTFQSCEHFGSKFVDFFLKMLKTWLVLFLRLTLQCWHVISLISFFLNGILWHGQLLSSLTLRTLLALGIFFFLFQFFFLRHRWPYTDDPSFGEKLYSNLCLFFLFTIFNNFLLIIDLLIY